MSARRGAWTARLGGRLLALYPELWRARYGEEMEALLEDDPPGARGLASLLGGAADAHVRPQRCWREGVAPGAAMRLSVGALFACWILVCVAGSSFAKQTEHFDPIEHQHKLLLVGRDMITLGAVLGAAAITIGGLPLVWQALRVAVGRRDRRLAALLASPALAGALVVGLAALLLLVAPSRRGGFPTAFVAETLVPVSLVALGWALVAALVPKAVMRRARPSAGLLRPAAWAGQVLAAAMVLVSAGLALYAPTLFSVPGAGVAASGPFGLSTRITLLFSLAAALVACGPALIAAGRARRAALQRA